MASLAHRHLYEYSARTPTGQKTRGTIAAPSAQAAADLLQDMRLGDVQFTARSSASLSGRPSADSIATNLPLWATLELLGQQQPTRQRNLAVQRLAGALRRGEQLSDAWPLAREAFPRRDRQFLDIAVANGRLPATLRAPAEFDALRKQYRAKIADAISFPVLAWIVASAVIIGFLAFGVAEFRHIYFDFNTELPALTQLLMDTANHLPQVAGALAIPLVFAALLWLALRAPHPSLIDAALFRLPAFGAAVRADRNVTFGRSLSQAVAGGTDLAAAIPLVCANLGTRRLRHDGDRVLAALQDQAPQPSLPEYRVLEPATVVTICLGEGDVPARLAGLAAIYQRQATPGLDDIGPLLAVMILPVIGFILATGVLALFLPMVRINERLT